VAYYDGYCVRATAASFVGVRERGGNNRSFTDKDLQDMMAEVGWKPGYAWCAFFVRAILDDCGVENTITGWSPTAYNKKDVIFTDGRFYQGFRDGDVLVMTMSYDKFKKTSRYKGIGHTGIVDRISEHSIRTIEGNTNDRGSRDSRSGDGVYVKIRPLSKNIHITRWQRSKKLW
jgi:CHAP domain